MWLFATLCIMLPFSPQNLLPRLELDSINSTSSSSDLLFFLPFPCSFSFLLSASGHDPPCLCWHQV
jgi:hypothetical protein